MFEWLEKVENNNKITVLYKFKSYYFTMELDFAKTFINILLNFLDIWMIREAKTIMFNVKRCIKTKTI